MTLLVAARWFAQRTCVGQASVGIAIGTPKHDMELIKSRLALAEQHYRENYRKAG